MLMERFQNVLGTFLKHFGKVKNVDGTFPKRFGNVLNTFWEHS